VTARSRRNERLRKRDDSVRYRDGSTRFEIEDSNWHRSKQLHQECEWKQGESAGKNKNLSLEGKARESVRRLPLVGNDHDGQDGQTKMLTGVALSWKPVTVELAYLARQAFHDFGKGRHAARLNFGDCFAYALAKITGEPLLFKGEDFKKTDLVSAL